MTPLRTQLHNYTDKKSQAIFAEMFAHEFAKASVGIAEIEKQEQLNKIMFNFRVITEFPPKLDKQVSDDFWEILNQEGSAPDRRLKNTRILLNEILLVNSTGSRTQNDKVPAAMFGQKARKTINF